MLLPTYAAICDDWFYLRLPRGVPLAAHEAEPGHDDRSATARVLRLLREHLNETTAAFGLYDLPLTPAGLKQLDPHLTPAFFESLLECSDPNDPNNLFKLTLSELAVYLGDITADQFGGVWRLARMPNYHQSVVFCENYEYCVWDAAMRRASSDQANRTLVASYETFASAVLARRQ